MHTDVSDSVLAVSVCEMVLKRVDLPWKLSGLRSDAFKFVLPIIMKTN